MSDEEDNPIDNLILKKAEERAAKKRSATTVEPPTDAVAAQSSPSRPPAAADASKKKKRRNKSSTPSTSLPNAAGVDPVAVSASEHNETTSTTQKATAAGPIGVVVLEDGDPEPNYEMQKLLRAPRYFDEVYEPKGVACWRCGKRGHLAKDCTESEAKPCVYCAQYGHESRDCPHSK